VSPFAVLGLTHQSAGGSAVRASQASGRERHSIGLHAILTEMDGPIGERG
jgi:hypothetical protein